MQPHSSLGILARPLTRGRRNNGKLSALITRRKAAYAPLRLLAFAFPRFSSFPSGLAPPWARKINKRASGFIEIGPFAPLVARFDGRGSRARKRERARKLTSRPLPAGVAARCIRTSLARCTCSIARISCESKRFAFSLYTVLARLPIESVYSGIEFLRRNGSDDKSKFDRIVQYSLFARVDRACSSKDIPAP